MLSVACKRSTLVALAFVLFAVPALLQAQVGRITGTVRGPGGGGLEAARVTATNNASGLARSTNTMPNGSYNIGALEPGTYTVAVSVVGFRRAVRTDVRVADGTTNVDFALDAVPLEPVIVTATFREQELAEVPFSIAAPTAQVLRSRGADNIEAIAANVAGLSVQNLGPGQSQVAVRGASAGQIARDQPGVKESVGAYLDDVPISTSLFTPDLDLFDVSRVEVLRGPQGTLFGSGSLSGTVRYITGQPVLGLQSSFGEVGGSWIEGGGAGASLKVGTNVPLGDRTAGRFVVYHSELGGWMDAVQPDLGVKRNVNSGRRSGLRAALQFAPSTQLSIVPRLVLQRVNMDGWNRIDTFNILANPYTTTRPPVALGGRRLFTQIDEPFTDDFVMGDVNVRLGLGGGMSLTSITSYTYRDILVVRDAGALTGSITGGSIGLPEEIYTLNSPLDDASNIDVFTQEVRLAGGADRLKWLVGGFFSTNRRDYAQSLLVSGFEAGTGIPTQGLRAPRDVLFWSDLSYDLRQTALFTEATLGVTDRVDLTAGVRYYNFNEDREQIFDGIFANDDTGTDLVSVPGSTKADGVAPRFIVSFRALEGTTLNLQASRGFRLGGINDPLNLPLCTVQDSIQYSGRDTWRDETAWNYEVGTKTLFMGGRGSLNVSAFHMDISDIQLVVTAGSCSSRLVFNVPKAISQGTEIELNLAPSPNFDFTISGTYTESEVRSTLTSVVEGEEIVEAGIARGNRLPSVPKLQGTAAATYRWQIRPGAQAFVSGTVNHIGSRFTQINDHGFGVCVNFTTDCSAGTVWLESFGDNTIGGPLTQSVFTFNPELPAYTLLNARVGMMRSRWEIALYVNNITDERALLALDRERGMRARVGYLTNQPRTVGLTLGFNH